MSSNRTAERAARLLLVAALFGLALLTWPDAALANYFRGAVLPSHPVPDRVRGEAIQLLDQHVGGGLVPWPIACRVHKDLLSLHRVQWVETTGPSLGAATNGGQIHVCGPAHARKAFPLVRALVELLVADGSHGEPHGIVERFSNAVVWTDALGAVLTLRDRGLLSASDTGKGNLWRRARLMIGLEGSANGGMQSTDALKQRAMEYMVAYYGLHELPPWAREIEYEHLSSYEGLSRALLESVQNGPPRTSSVEWLGVH